MKGLTAIVTGCSSGLGLAVVQRLLKLGCNVAGLDLKSNSDIKNSKYKFFETDVTSESGVEQSVQQTCAAFDGNLHILVNCAGIGVAQTTVQTRLNKPHSLADFSRVLHVNTVGTFNMVRVAAYQMTHNTRALHVDLEDDTLMAAAVSTNGDGSAESRLLTNTRDVPARGVIINTASVAAFEGQRGQVAYSASKAAIAGMTLPLARDLAQYGIRVMAIAPGLFDTPLLAGLPDKVLQHVSRLAPFPNRLGRPAEFAHLVQAIIENPFLNGDVIRLDGAIRLPP